MSWSEKGHFVYGLGKHLGKQMNAKLERCSRIAINKTVIQKI